MVLNLLNHFCLFVNNNIISLEITTKTIDVFVGKILARGLQAICLQSFLGVEFTHY